MNMHSKINTYGYQQKYGHSSRPTISYQGRSAHPKMSMRFTCIAEESNNSSTDSISSSISGLNKMIYCFSL